MSTLRLDGPPDLAALYGRAALGGVPGASRLPFVGGRGERLPDLELELDGVQAETDRLADYCRVCGFTLRDTLPATFPHVLAFPLQMRLMADGNFPFALLGLVHLDNAITQHRPVRLGETLQLRVRATDLRPHPKGRAFTLVAEAHVGSELVWEEAGTILRRGRGEDVPMPKSFAGPPENAEPVTVWKLDEGLGRRYAAASGDRNPIHMHALSAKAFGFPRAIAHGMWSQARCLAQLEGKAPDAFTTEARFLKPVLLPARVGFSVIERPVKGRRRKNAAPELAFAMRDARKDTPHLEGVLTPA